MANALNGSQIGLHPRSANSSELKAIIAPKPMLRWEALPPRSQARYANCARNLDQ
jgi:hypothetical protein